MFIKKKKFIITQDKRSAIHLSFSVIFSRACVKHIDRAETMQKRNKIEGTENLEKQRKKKAGNRASRFYPLYAKFDADRIDKRLKRT